MPHPTPDVLLARLAERKADVAHAQQQLDEAQQGLCAAVVAARNGGGSWRQIAKHLGLSPQAVWERYENAPGLNNAEKRPEQAAARVWKAGEKVRAYHPRLHPDLAVAEVARDFANQGRDTFVRVRFSDLPDEIRTHKANVFELSS